jgi:hypothetical protein
MPIPVSRTVTRAQPLSALAMHDTEMRPPTSVNLTALESRLTFSGASTPP